MSTPGLALYRGAATLAGLAGPAWLRARVRRGKEDARRWPEKLGHPSAARPDGELVWLHGASVGEALSLIPLAELIAREHPKAGVLMTCATLTAAELIARRAPAAAIQQFAPLDAPAAVERFLGHWRPNLAVFAESELWPNLILAAKRRGARTALVSARLSPSSLAGWRRAPRAAAAVLGGFDLILARDEAAAAGLRSLGARVEGLADLKFGAAPLAVDPAARAAAATLFPAPPLLAASTHPGEDEIVLRAFAEARAAGAVVGNAQLIIAPRHPDRGAAIAGLARDSGLTVALRSWGLATPADVLVADTLGELGLWFALSSVAIVCGGFVPGVGGHNPLEAARAGCPIAFGPHVEAWPIYGEMAAAGAATPVSADSLAGLMVQALAGDQALAAMAGRARAFVEPRDAAARAALPRVLELLA